VPLDDTASIAFLKAMSVCFAPLFGSNAKRLPHFGQLPELRSEYLASLRQ
jgi:hypothetical protein